MRQSLSASKFRKNAGSALIGTLIMMSIVTMVIIAMIGTANHSTRMTRDQLEYEAAYTAAISGVHTGRAMLNYPTLLLTMLNRASLQEDVSGLLNLEDNVKNTLDGVSGMVADVLTGNIGGLVPGVDPLTGGLLARHGLGSLGTRLPDGRIVLIDVPQKNGKIIGFPNDRNGAKDSLNLFSGESESGFTSYVDRLRITTAPINDLKGILTLKDVALIIEARGVVDNGYRRKERVVQERVLIYPELTEAPLVSAAAAVVSGGSFLAAGKSGFNIAWGPVMAKGDIELLTLKFIPGLLTKSKLEAGNHFRGAGVNIPNMSDLGGPMLEKWLKWKSGDGTIKITENKIRIPLLGNLLSQLLSGPNAPTDLFSDLRNGGLLNSILGLLTPNNFELAGDYEVALRDGDDAGLFSVNDDGVAEDGALVQKSEEVSDTIENYLGNTMNYATWKERAIKRNNYVKPLENPDNQGPKFGNSFDQPLYVTSNKQLTTDEEAGEPLTSLDQLSMNEELAAVNGHVHRTDDMRIDDSLLFVDYVTGSEEQPGPVKEHMLGNSFFWKGVLYVCGNLKIKNGSQRTPIFTKSPDQFADDPDSMNRGQALENVVIDGILFSTGQVTSLGNAVIYGTLGTKQSISGESAPNVFFNFMNSLGRLKLPIKTGIEASVVLGRTYEVDEWIE